MRLLQPQDINDQWSGDEPGSEIIFDLVDSEESLCTDSSEILTLEAEEPSTDPLDNALEFNRQLHVSLQKKQEEISALKEKNAQLKELAKQAEHYAKIMGPVSRPASGHKLLTHCCNAELSEWHLAASENFWLPSASINTQQQALSKTGGVKRQLWPNDHDGISKDSEPGIHSSSSDQDLYSRCSNQDPYSVGSDQDPCPGRSDQDPISRSSDQDPYSRSSIQDPFSIHSGQDPFSTSADSLLRHCNQDPYSRSTDQDSYSGRSAQDPISRNSDQDPFSIVYDQDHFSTSSEQDPSLTSSDQDPSSRRSNPDLFSGGSNQDPFSRCSDKEPFLYIPGQGTFSKRSDQDPFTGSSNQDPYTKTSDPNSLLQNFDQDPFSTSFDQDPYSEADEENHSDPKRLKLDLERLQLDSSGKFCLTEPVLMKSRLESPSHQTSRCSQSLNTEMIQVFGAFHGLKVVRARRSITSDRSDCGREGAACFRTSVREHSTVRTNVFLHGKTFTSHTPDGSCRFLWVPNQN
ncbi:hypothetical protein AMEX_G23392 [Astyanax mexicanus]|uniref:Multicilin n=1 Tax=Astyanax mexicanus TaxID=7994 RepID=A0A8T2L245_ASTMX|nr:hypothetical protein AMEX_G23392 [Astyanax mexicanus]